VQSILPATCKIFVLPFYFRTSPAPLQAHGSASGACASGGPASLHPRRSPASPHAPAAAALPPSARSGCPGPALHARARLQGPASLRFAEPKKARRRSSPRLRRPLRPHLPAPVPDNTAPPPGTRVRRRGPTSPHPCKTAWLRLPAPASPHCRHLLST